MRAPLPRVLLRGFVIAVAVAFFSMVGVQFANVIGRNVAMARELHGVEHDVAHLRAKRARQEREIRRLSDPRGAIPEIHDRLHLVGDREAIIYLKGADRSTP